MSGATVYCSALGPAIQAHVDLKRVLGRQFDREAGILGDLDRFLAARSADDLTADEFAAWALTLGRLAPTSRRQYLRIAHNLCLYRRRTHPRCFVPDPRGFPAPEPPRPARIFSAEQILALVHAATQLPACARSPLQAEVYRLAVTLAYAAGLRRGELVRLGIGDYCRRDRTILVRRSKGRKSRLVALAAGVAGEVERYLQARRRFPHGDDAPLLAHGRSGLSAYSGRGVDLGFRRLFGAAGIGAVAGRLPRLHDLRHTHAVHVLLRWYRAGIDPQAMLPVLAASMGHVSLASTAYYLTQLDPVLVQAAKRFACYARSIVAPQEDRDHA